VLSDDDDDDDDDVLVADNVVEDEEINEEAKGNSTEAKSQSMGSEGGVVIPVDDTTATGAVADVGDGACGNPLPPPLSVLR